MTARLEQGSWRVSALREVTVSAALLRFVATWPSAVATWQRPALRPPKAHHLRHG